MNTTYLISFFIWSVLPLILYWVYLQDQDTIKKILWLAIILIFGWVGLLACFVVKRVLT